jgi:competence protein ComEC
VFVPRPALRPCVAWLAGAGLGALWQPGVRLALASAAVALVFGAVIGYRTQSLGRAALVPLAGAGLALGALSLDAHRERVACLFGPTQDVLETEVRGALARAPERAFDGTRVIELDGARTNDAAMPRVRVRLRVASSTAASEVDALVRGDLVRVWCRLVRPGAPRLRDSPDPRTRSAARGVVAQGSVKSARLVVREHAGHGGRPLIDRLRRAARIRLDRALGPTGPVRGLTAAMLLGDRELLEPQALRALRDSGLVHVVAISGLQVGLVALALAELVRRSRLPRALVFVVALLLLALFGELVGAEPSVLRAIGAAIVLAAGRAVGRDGDPLNSLALVTAALVGLAPCSIAEPALQLSVAATAGIVLGARPIADRLPLPRFAAVSCGVTLGAYGATLPIVAWWFGRVAPISVCTNLVAAPLSAAALGLGYPALALADVPVAGTALVRLAGLPNELLLAIAARAAEQPGAGVVVAPPGLATIAAYYTALAILARAPAPRAPGARGLAGLAFALIGLAIHLGAPPPERIHRAPQAAVLDVGQGQAVALRGARAEVVLVDAAGSTDPRYDPGERIVVPWLVRNGARRVSILSVSHEHADHAAGAFAVLRDLEVGELWLPIGWEKSPRLAALAALARSRGVAIVLAERGMKRIGPPMPIEILGPARVDAHLSANDRSIVLRIGTAPCRVLVPADLDPSGEASLVQSGLDVAAEALVASHHGSKNGSSRAFLDRVRPRWAIVSCGVRNRFGHPHPESLSRLREVGARVLRTDRDGTVTLSCGAAGPEPITDRRIAAGGE